MGKTAVALKLAKVAAINNYSTAFFSLEMTKHSLAERLCYGVSGIDVDNFKQGNLSELDWREFEKAYEILHKLPFYISDRSYDKISSIRNKCKKN